MHHPATASPRGRPGRPCAARTAARPAPPSVAASRRWVDRHPPAPAHPDPVRPARARGCCCERNTLIRWLDRTAPRRHRPSARSRALAQLRLRRSASTSVRFRHPPPAAGVAAAGTARNTGCLRPPAPSHARWPHRPRTSAARGCPPRWRPRRSPASAGCPPTIAADAGKSG